MRLEPQSDFVQFGGRATASSLVVKSLQTARSPNCTKFVVKYLLHSGRCQDRILQQWHGEYTGDVVSTPVTW